MTQGSNEHPLYQHILVATDFSPHAEAAFRQAVYLARQSGAKITLLHTLPDLRQLVESASYQAKVDFMYGERSLFHREVTQASEAKLHAMVTGAEAADLEIRVMTTLGTPAIEITHEVQKSGCDLVLTGTRGMAAWRQIFVGSTAKRLIRTCPTSLWIVKHEQQIPPKVVLAATDFSEVSREAVLEAFWIAKQSAAEFHLLHVIDIQDVPEEILAGISGQLSVREQVNQEAKHRLDHFIDSLHVDPGLIRSHLSLGTPWQEIKQLAKHRQADLIAIGTIGRSGIQGLLLGNTAEKVLDHCDCSILTVKPVGFVSPILPTLETMAAALPSKSS